MGSWLRIVGWLLWGPGALTLYVTLGVCLLLGAYAIWNRLSPPDQDVPASDVSKQAAELADEVEDYLQSQA